MVIITNNPDVKEKYPDICEYIPGTVRDVFRKVRDEIHKGAKLISHPISGSLKPGQIPYKSVAILPAKEGNHIDLRSLAYIEDSIEFYRLTARKRLIEKDRLDYKVIDLDLINNVLHSRGIYV